METSRPRWAHCGPENGHPEPYHIRYWQVGNEQSGPDYEKRLPEFCRAMKLADPKIELLSSYPKPGVLRGARDWLDYVSPHHYDCANLAGCDADFESIRRLTARAAPGRTIRVGVTEWNTTAGDAGPRRARLWTLENALACSRYQNLSIAIATSYRSPIGPTSSTASARASSRPITIDSTRPRPTTRRCSMRRWPAIAR